MNQRNTSRSRWFKGLMPGSAANAPPTTDVETGGAKSSWFGFGGSKASGNGAPAAAAAKPAPAAPAAAATTSAAAPAAAPAPAAKSGGWFGGGKGIGNGKMGNGMERLIRKNPRRCDA